MRKVLLHRPTSSINLINQQNYKDYLFDAVPEAEQYLKEHDKYAELLRSLGVEVLELADFIKANNDLKNQRPNLVYMHDIAVITSNGALLSKMSSLGRQKEEIVVKEALQNLGISIFYEFTKDDAFEGCLLLSPRTMLLANTERFNEKSIEKFIPIALKLFEEIIYVETPQERRFMHADMIYGRVGDSTALAFLPAFLEVHLITKRGNTKIKDFKDFMKKRGTEIIEISDDEQKKWACTFVPVEPNTIIQYDIAYNQATLKKLKERGIEVIMFHPQALLAGGGSLRCLTMQILRD